MNSDLVSKIENHPKYKELISKRTRFGWTLAVIMLVIYYGFILIIAFDPKLFAAKLSEDAVMTLGMPVGVLVILSAFILTGIYVVRANGEFDSLTQQIKDEVQK